VKRAGTQGRNLPPCLLVTPGRQWGTAFQEERKRHGSLSLTDPLNHSWGFSVSFPFLLNETIPNYLRLPRVPFCRENDDTFDRFFHLENFNPEIVLEIAIKRNEWVRGTDWCRNVKLFSPVHIALTLILFIAIHCACFKGEKKLPWRDHFDAHNWAHKCISADDILKDKPKDFTFYLKRGEREIVV